MVENEDQLSHRLGFAREDSRWGWVPRRWWWPKTVVFWRLKVGVGGSLKFSLILYGYFDWNQADLRVQPLIRGMTLFVDVALQVPISWQPLCCREAWSKHWEKHDLNGSELVDMNRGSWVFWRVGIRRSCQSGRPGGLLQLAPMTKYCMLIYDRGLIIEIHRDGNFSCY